MHFSELKSKNVSVSLPGAGAAWSRTFWPGAGAAFFAWDLGRPEPEPEPPKNVAAPQHWTLTFAKVRVLDTLRHLHLRLLSI